MRTAKEESRNKFLVAAIEEMQTSGISGLSIRRVAERCGVSSGAPYKHFKNKSELLLESIRFIGRQWGEIQFRVIADCCDNPREKLVEISCAYVRFLCENPAYQSVLMLSDNTLSPEQLAEKAKISALTERIIDEYCRSVEMSDSDKIRKTYAVRSFIFGAAFMINSGFFPNSEDSIGLARECIEREFDID